MPKKIVPLITGEVYHIYNRGVDKRKIFLDKVDYFRFHQSMQMFNTQEPSESLFRLQLPKNKERRITPIVHIHAYCLLSNHYHLLLTQVQDGGISEFMKRLGGGYTSYFNERNKRSGSLFQGKFKRVHVESDKQLLHLAAYINLNNLVHDRKDYFLSSYKVYTREIEEKFIHNDLIIKQFANYLEFKKFANESIQETKNKRLLDKAYEKETFCE